MLQNIDLRELAAMEGSGRDFVSVYFATEHGLNGLRSRERQMQDILSDTPDEAEHFQLSMESIHKLIDENPDDISGAQGVCVFACALLNFVRGYPLAQSVVSQIYVGTSPYIRPLAELQDEYQTFGLVACDNRSTRLFLVTNDTAVLEDQVRGNVKNHVRKGGWSQQRYERRRDNQLQQYAREVAGDLESLAKQQNFERILLMGSEETMNEIEREMSQQLRDMLIGKEAFDLHRKEQEMVEEAYRAYFEEERDWEQQLWQRIKNAFKRHGLAATGATDCLAALLQGRADQVIATRDVKILGMHCRECDHVVHGTPQTCQQCGADSLFEIDLIDKLARQAELTSAKFEFSDEIPGLTKVGHVAALLRW